MNSTNWPTLFISLEGIDGCGKTTQIKLLKHKIEPWIQVKDIKEPGGSEASLTLRDYILSKDRPDFGVIGNALLFEVSRANTVESVLEPALDSSMWILCDRYVHSGFAYSGVYENIPKLFRISEEICPVWPDITFFIDIPVEESYRRRQGKIEDRIEARGFTYLNRVRNNYKSFVKCDPLKFTRYPTESMLLGLDTFIEIDGLRPEDVIAEDIYSNIMKRREILSHSNRLSSVKTRKAI